MSIQIIYFIDNRVKIVIHKQRQSINFGDICTVLLIGVVRAINCSIVRKYTFQVVENVNIVGPKYFDCPLSVGDLAKL
jgi:hypothetical protein